MPEVATGERQTTALILELRQREGEKFEIAVQYVVSALTFREMPEAACLLRRYHVDWLRLIAFRDWGVMESRRGPDTPQTHKQRRSD